MADTAIEINCLECKKSFLYVQRFNVVKKYCEKCAKDRTAASKKRFREELKRASARKPDKFAVYKSLSAIPDRRVSYNKIFGALMKVAT